MKFFKSSNYTGRSRRPRRAKKVRQRATSSRRELLSFNWHATELEQRLLFAADLGVGTSVTGQFVGDDAILDKAQINGNQLEIFRGISDGIFDSAPAQQLSLADWHPSGLLSLGFNGDSHPDLAVINGTVDGVQDRFEVFTATGDAQQYEHNAIVSSALVTGDFNGDGKMDFAVLGADVSSGDQLQGALTPFPLTRVGPIDSFIYRGSVQGAIGIDDQDTYTVSLNEGETLTAIVTPTATLKPSIKLTGPGISGSIDLSPGVDGIPAVPFRAVAAGTNLYQVTISSKTISGETTTGTFQLELIRNSAVELEALGGVANNSPNAAQDLEHFQGSTLEVLQTAVFGSGATLFSENNSGAKLFSENFDGATNGFTIDNSFGSGNGLWHISTVGRQADLDSNHTPPGSIYFGRLETPLGGGNYDAGTVGGAVRSPLISLPTDSTDVLSFRSFIDVESAPDFDELFVVVIDGGVRTTVLAKSDSSLPASTGGTWQSFRADLTAFAGHTIQLEFTFDSVDGSANQTEGWYIDDVSVTTSPLAVDWYKFTLKYGESANIVATDPAGEPIELELYAPDGVTPVAFGVVTSNQTVEIQNFVDQTPGEGIYYVRVIATDDYRLVVEKNKVVLDPVVDQLPSGPQIATQDFRGTVSSTTFQHIGILSLEFHVDKLSRPLL